MGQITLNCASKQEMVSAYALLYRFVHVTCCSRSVQFPIDHTCVIT